MDNIEKLSNLFESFNIKDPKERILNRLEFEIDYAQYESHGGHWNYNELISPSLLIGFIWDTNSVTLDKRMIDIEVSILDGDETETILYSEDLSDELIKRILIQGEKEEYASDLDVEI